MAESTSSILARAPAVKMCEAREIVAAAGIVDHVVAHKGNLALFWNERNWQALCAGCHSSRKQMLESPGKVQPHASWGGQSRKQTQCSINRSGSLSSNNPND